MVYLDGAKEKEKVKLKELLQKWGLRKSDEERKKSKDEKRLKVIIKEMAEYDKKKDLDSANEEFGVGLNLELQNQMKQKEKPKTSEKESIFKSIFNRWKRAITHIFL